MKKPYFSSIDVFVVIFLLLALLISSLALAKENNPEEKVKLVFVQVETSLLTLKNANNLTQNNVRDVLTQLLLPEVNTVFFSNKVLNKNLPKVPIEIKAEFVTELSAQLINSFSLLLSKYNGESMTIGDSKQSKSGKIAMVNVAITGKTKTNKAVLKLIQNKDEGWKFFDIIVEGISLLETKQKEINSSFNKRGAEGTLLHLKKINQRSSTSSSL
jgi:phospholipid transport system substrate-binding protein